MRTVQISDCSYKTFAKIRTVLVTHVPFALFLIDYDPKSKLATFNFWDSDYIPEPLRTHIKTPPANADLLKKVIEELTKKEEESPKKE